MTEFEREFVISTALVDRFILFVGVAWALFLLIIFELIFELRKKNKKKSLKIEIIKICY